MSWRDSQAARPRRDSEEPWRSPEERAEARRRDDSRDDVMGAMVLIWRGPGTFRERIGGMCHAAEGAGFPELAAEVERIAGEALEEGRRRGRREARARLALEARADRALRAAGIRRPDRGRRP